jgi:hypothetical protein
MTLYIMGHYIHYYKLLLTIETRPTANRIVEDHGFCCLSQTHEPKLVAKCSNLLQWYMVWYGTGFVYMGVDVDVCSRFLGTS